MPQTNATKITIIPQEIFIGDRIQLTFSFSTSNTLSQNQEFAFPLKIQNQTAELLQTPEYTLLNAVLTLKNGEYVCSIDFIPWKTGIIHIQEINFGTPEKPFIVTIPQITVNSITQKTKSLQLKPALPPLLIPGTTYTLYAFTFGGLLFFALFCLVLIKLKKIRLFFAQLKKTIALKQNYKKFLKNLRLLEKNKETPQNFAHKLVHLIRDYCQIRFLKPFTSATTSEIPLLLQNQIPQNTIDLLMQILTACDFIRFSSPKNYTGSLNGFEFDFTEQKSIIELTRTIAFECERVSKKEDAHVAF